MEPALKYYQYLILRKNVLGSFHPGRGEIILYSDPNSKLEKVGRVIALPSEKITLSRGSVYIDKGGVDKLDEPYLDSKVSNHAGAEDIWFEAGSLEYIVLADNQRSNINFEESTIEQANVLAVMWVPLFYPSGPKTPEVN